MHLGPILHPLSSGSDSHKPESASTNNIVVAHSDLSIEDGIRFGIVTALDRNSSVILQLKGIELEIQPQDRFEATFARYKEREFNAYASNYEINFIQRNAAMYTAAAATLRRVANLFSNPVRMLDIGCGTGFGLRETFSEQTEGKYFGLDPAVDMLAELNFRAMRMTGIEVTAREAKAGILNVDNVQNEITALLGGRPQIIALIAAMHVINKHEVVGSTFNSMKQMLDPSGRIVIGNYFHHSKADFEAFAIRYKAAGMIHQPTPPEQLFTPTQMEPILRAFWLEVESCEEMVCTDGLRAYVMVAKHRG